MQNAITKTSVKYLVLVGRPRRKEGHSILFKHLFRNSKGFGGLSRYFKCVPCENEIHNQLVYHLIIQVNTTLNFVFIMEVSKP